MRLASELPTDVLMFAVLHRAERQLIARVVSDFRGQACMQALLVRPRDLVSAMLLEARTVLCRMQVSSVTARPPPGNLRQQSVPTIRTQARPVTSVVNSSVKNAMRSASSPLSVMWLSMLFLLAFRLKSVSVRCFRMMGRVFAMLGIVMGVDTDALPLLGRVVWFAFLLFVCSSSVMVTKSESSEELFRSTNGRAMFARGSRCAMLLMTRNVRNERDVMRLMVANVSTLSPVCVVAARLCMVSSTNSSSMVVLFSRFTLLVTVEKTKLSPIMGTSAGTFPLTLVLESFLLVTEQSDRMTRRFAPDGLVNGLS